MTVCPWTAEAPSKRGKTMARIIADEAEKGQAIYTGAVAGLIGLSRKIFPSDFLKYLLFP
jgi:hypothetical protein